MQKIRFEEIYMLWPKPEVRPAPELADQITHWPGHVSNVIEMNSVYAVLAVHFLKCPELPGQCLIC